jgi:HPt (histidine-containing phosphotransfer) domain-containing protein
MTTAIVGLLSKLNSKIKFVDLARLQDTLEMVSDETDPHGYHFISLFLQECHSDITFLTTHLADRQLTARIAHRWSGRCAQLGITRMEGQGRKLQALAGGSEAEMREMVEKMKEDLGELEAALETAMEAYSYVVPH